MNIFSSRLKFKKSTEKKIDNNYYYPIKECLENIYIDNFKDVYMCFYFIDKEKPILKYFLKKNKNLEFFKLDIHTFIKSDCIKFIKNTFNSEFNIMGYKVYNKKMFIFINLLNYEKNNIGRWCIMDEICNKKMFLDYSISESVTSFFLNNSKFIYLRNNDNLKIEIPIVAFQNCDNLLELMYYNYNNNKDKEFYDYSNCKKKFILRYILFFFFFSIHFNKPYQYNISYVCKPESFHE